MITNSSEKSVPFSIAVAIIVAVAFVFMAVPAAFGETPATGNARALLDEAKQKQIERKRSAMQKELARLEEDLKQGQTEMGDLEQNISRVGNAVNESKSNSELLAGRRKNVTQDLELLTLRSDAERLKAEGLNLLSGAHAKSKEALMRRNEELEIRKAVISAEFAKTEDSHAGSESSRSGKSEASRSLTELRKNLAKAESKSALANYRAREAMDVASKRLQQAEDAAAKVEKKQAEYAEKAAPR